MFNKQLLEKCWNAAQYQMQFVKPKTFEQWYQDFFTEYQGIENSVNETETKEDSII